MLNEVNPVLNWQKLLLCNAEKDFTDMFISFSFSSFRCPEIPLIFPQDIACVGKRQCTIIKSNSADMIRVAMGEDDYVYAFRPNPLCLKVLKKSSGIWAKTARARVHKYPMITGVYQ